jgi:hypothetical protein
MDPLDSSKILAAQPQTKPCFRGHVKFRDKYGNCPDCRRIRGRRSRANNTERGMFQDARRRAAKRSLPCTITEADIIIPEFCPLLGIKLERSADGHGGPSSPSLDKINPALGYVPGNVWVISNRANTLKSDATLRELQTLVSNLIKVYVPLPWEG